MQDRQAPAAQNARDWAKVLTAYREPSEWRSWFELAVTVVPFFGLWALAWAALSINPWISFALSIPIGAFLVRIFAIQHDCGHGAFFKSRQTSDWVGRTLGVLTLTPYVVWKRAHSMHHSASGNLDRRGIGEILTLTVAEYQALTWFGRLKYRLYRHPVVLFAIGPAYLFLLQNRLPLGFMDKRDFWISAMGTNLALAVILTLIYVTGGALPLLLIFLPSTLLGATAGVWLFYVQHQFEEAHWDREGDWNVHECALHGSSHYVMPRVLQWMSANIGIHHVHHLQSRVPFYRLPEVLRDHKALGQTNRLTIPESLSLTRLHLWDEGERRLISFAEAHALRNDAPAIAVPVTSPKPNDQQRPAA